MKKRALAVLGVLLICVLCVFAAGLLLKRNREQDQQMAENETDTAAEAAVSIEEQEYINEAIRDTEIRKEGYTTAANTGNMEALAIRLQSFGCMIRTMSCRFRTMMKGRKASLPITIRKPITPAWRFRLPMNQK